MKLFMLRDRAWSETFLLVAAADEESALAVARMKSHGAGRWEVMDGFPLPDRDGKVWEHTFDNPSDPY